MERAEVEHVVVERVEAERVEVERLMAECVEAAYVQAGSVVKAHGEQVHYVEEGHEAQRGVKVLRVEAERAEVESAVKLSEEECRAGQGLEEKEPVG
jgi:hypothetical protein